MNKAIAIFVSICLSLPALAQVNVDSLWGVWNDPFQEDTTRLNALHTYVEVEYLHEQSDSVFHLAQLQYDFAKERGLKKQMARAYNQQGFSLSDGGDYHGALKTHEKALEIQQEIGDQAGMGWSFLRIGTIYDSWGLYLKALDFYQKSIQEYEEINHKSGLAVTLNNLALLYRSQGDHSKALEILQECMEINTAIGNKMGISRSYFNMGSSYNSLGNHEMAMEYFQLSLKIKEEIGHKNGVAGLYGAIARIHALDKDYTKALEFYQKGLNIWIDHEKQEKVSSFLIGIGFVYLDMEKHKEALESCSQGLDLAEQIGLVPQQENGCYCLYEVHKASGNGIKALEYHERMLVLSDSLKSEETAKKLQQMEFAKVMLADSLQKEEEKLKVEMAHQNEVAEEEKTRNLAIGGGLIFLLAAVALFTRVRYVRKAKNRIEKEKDRSENLLLNILPAEIAEELKEKGEAAARDFDMVSILFTDFKGFTEASEKLSAADLVAEINVCFKAFDGIVGKYNIEKIKTIGDAYMCAGGLPVPDENAAVNTLHAALEMQAFMVTRKAERDAAGLPAFEMRVGIHTGSVVAGIVGVKKFQYDIWGDTVNTASRMESSGEIGQVNISEATYELVKNDASFSFTSRGKIAAKGKGEMQMYFVLRTQAEV